MKALILLACIALVGCDGPFECPVRSPSGKAYTDAQIEQCERKAERMNGQWRQHVEEEMTKPTPVQHNTNCTTFCSGGNMVNCNTVCTGN